MATDKHDLKSLTIEELKVRQKMMTTAVILMVIAVLVMAASGIFIAIRTGFSAISVLPICFLPLVGIFSAQLRKIKDELKLRTQ